MFKSLTEWLLLLEWSVVHAEKKEKKKKQRRPKKSVYHPHSWRPVVILVSLPAEKYRTDWNVVTAVEWDLHVSREFIEKHSVVQVTFYVYAFHAKGAWGLLLPNESFKTSVSILNATVTCHNGNVVVHLPGLFQCLSFCVLLLFGPPMRTSYVRKLTEMPSK